MSTSQQIEWTLHKQATLFVSLINILEVLRMNELCSFILGECHLPFFCSIDTYSHYDEAFLGVFICWEGTFQKLPAKQNTLESLFLLILPFFKRRLQYA